jgi:hypothetical protein
MKLRVFLAILSLSAFSLGGTAQAASSGRSSVLDLAENQYSATTILLTSSGSKIRTVKRDSYGGLYWAKDFSAAKVLTVGQVQVDSSGSVYVGLLQQPTSGSGGLTYTLLKYTSTGALAWSRNYADSTFLYGSPGGLALDSAGNIYLLIWGNAGFSGTSSRLLKYNSAGTQLFVKNIQPQYSTQLASLRIDSANGIYVSGEADPGNPSTGNLLTAKYDTLGNQLWQRIDAVGANVRAGDLALDATGQPVAATASSTATSSTLFVQKVTKTGTLLWNQSVPTNGFVPIGVIVDSTGNVLACGQQYGTGSGPDRTGFGVARLDGLTGAVLWNVRYAGNNIGVNAIAEEANGTYLTVGTDFNSATSSNEIRAVRFEPVDGANNISFYFNVTSDNQGRNVLPSSLAGDFYVTGEAFWGTQRYPLNWKVSGTTTLWSWITTTTYP